MIKWNDTYKIGIGNIDSDHKKLFDIFFKIKNSNESGDVVEVITGIHELESYTNYHFSREEAIMVASEYKDYKIHKVSHDHFKHIIDCTVSLLMEDINYVNIGVLIGRLEDWLINHILKADMLYTNCFHDFFRSEFISESCVTA